MSKEVLIKADGVSKKFCRNLKRSLIYGGSDIIKGFLGRERSRDLRNGEFWAINDVSFEVKRGECLALIGHNGAGKSTLLKMLNGLIRPDKGRIEMHGKVGALIELGAGFSPLLTGRENVYNNGAVLGFTKEEIDRKFDEIVQFSELEEFIDTPVQNYSSGMKVRLGFSIAAQMEPDILLLDEVLAVGDAGFRMKSYNKMAELMNKTAVIFVSHSMPDVAYSCDKALFLSHGVIKYYGYNVSHAIQSYFASFKSSNFRIEFNEGADIVDLKVNGLLNSYDEPIELNYGDDLNLDFDLLIKEEISEYSISLIITDKDLKIVGEYYSNKFQNNFLFSENSTLRITLNEFLFIDGDYSITYFITEERDGRNKIMATYRYFTKIRMKGLNDNIYAAIYLKGKSYQNGNELAYKI